MRAVKAAFRKAVNDGRLPHSPVAAMSLPAEAVRDHVVSQKAYKAVIAAITDQIFADLVTFVWMTVPGCGVFDTIPPPLERRTGIVDLDLLQTVNAPAEGHDEREANATQEGDMASSQPQFSKPVFTEIGGIGQRSSNRPNTITIS